MNKMEYPIKDDFFLKFKAILNDKNEFIDYILVDTSSGFISLSGKSPDKLIGRRLSDLIITDGDFIPGGKELFYHMIPNTKRKFERYIADLDKWYFISMFSDKRDSLLIFYTNISKLKEKSNNRHESVANDLNKTNILNYHIDRLTNLYNRNFFEIELDRLNTERQLPLSFIIGDLNGMKLINDAFGHQTGDSALKKVASIMKRVFRKEDIISRFGGDEFAILLPKTNDKTAQKIVERLKVEFSKNPLEFIQLNMSFGTATKNTSSEDIKDLIVKAEERMYFDKLKESKIAKESMINHLKHKLQLLSDETWQNHERLISLSILFAEKMNLTSIEKEELKMLCEYHDIGKTGIPSYILDKKEPLTNDEWIKLKRHSEIGYHIMKSSGGPLSVDELILVHHERWDGKGYPGLLSGKKIPLVGRMFAIVDAYEARVNDRPYKDRLSPKEALGEIRNNAGSQFDPELAEIFVSMMDGSNEKIG